MRVRVSPAMHPKVYFLPDALPATIPRIAGIGDSLAICWLANLEARPVHTMSYMAPMKHKVTVCATCRQKPWTVLILVSAVAAELWLRTD